MNWQIAGTLACFPMLVGCAGDLPLNNAQRTPAPVKNQQSAAQGANQQACEAKGFTYNANSSPACVCPFEKSQPLGVDACVSKDIIARIKTESKNASDCASDNGVWQPAGYCLCPDNKIFDAASRFCIVNTATGLASQTDLKRVCEVDKGGIWDELSSSCKVPTGGSGNDAFLQIFSAVLESVLNSQTASGTHTPVPTPTGGSGPGSVPPPPP